MNDYLNGISNGLKPFETDTSEFGQSLWSF